MSRHHDVPVVVDGGAVEYLPASTPVKLDRPPRRGLGRARERETYPLGDIDRDGRGSLPRATLAEDGREVRVEAWQDEALRLRAELSESQARVTELSATVAKLMVASGCEP